MRREEKRREEKKTVSVNIISSMFLAIMLTIPLVKSATVRASDMTSPEPALPAVVEAVWTTKTISSQQPLKKFEFNLTNRVDETVYVDVEAIYMGLGDQDVTELLGNYRLASFENKKLYIDSRDVGIQSATNSSEVIIRLRIERDSGQILTKFSTPLFYHFDDTHKNVIAYDRTLLVEKYNGGLISGDPYKASGFKRKKSGQLIHVDKSSANMAEQSSLIATDSDGGLQGNVISTAIVEIPDDTFESIRAAQLSSIPNSSEGVVDDSTPSTRANSNVRICSRWKTFFEDSGIGEDAWTHTTLAFRWAAYTYFELYTSSGNKITSGFLDNVGCSSTLSLPPGDYRLLMGSDTKRIINGSVYKYSVRHIKRNASNDIVRTHYGQSIYFSVSSGQTGDLILYPANQYGFSNLNAIAGSILNFSPPIIQPGAHNIWYGLDCPGYTDGSSCYNPGDRVVYISEPATIEKFVITHELGHQATDDAYGTPKLDYRLAAVGDPTTPWVCRCDHVTTYSQKHCLQSREHTATTITEGFGYFWSAKIWNYTTQNDCIMAYPKQVKFPNGTVYQPPFAADCRNPVLWKFLNCNDNADTGTEWDWMQFLWGMHAASGSYNVSMSDLYNLMYRACGNSRCDTGDKTTWSDVEAAAWNKWAGNQDAIANFYDWSNWTGVSQ